MSIIKEYVPSKTTTVTRIVPGKVVLELTPRQAALLACVLGNVGAPGSLFDEMRGAFLTKLCGGDDAWYKAYEAGAITGTVMLKSNITQFLPE